MSIQKEVETLKVFSNLQILANEIVEGFISGIHKSPFHGFSSQFSEYKQYVVGDSINKIDWKRFAKTEKLYIKKYDDETNLRCHIIIDESSSMFYPEIILEKENKDLNNINKIKFVALTVACIVNLLKRQRDVVGLTTYSDQIEFYCPAKGNERNYQVIYSYLTELFNKSFSRGKTTETTKILEQASEKMGRRGLVFVFTDMLQVNEEKHKLFESLQRLKYHKHKVILFHTYSNKYEKKLNFQKNIPIKFTDIETSDTVNTYLDGVKDDYNNLVENYFKELELNCLKYGIKYVATNIDEGVNKVLNTFLLQTKINKRK